MMALATIMAHPIGGMGAASLARKKGRTTTRLGRWMSHMKACLSRLILTRAFQTAWNPAERRMRARAVGLMKRRASDQAQGSSGRGDPRIGTYLRTGDPTPPARGRQGAMPATGGRSYRAMMKI